MGSQCVGALTEAGHGCAPNFTEGIGVVPSSAILLVLTLTEVLGEMAVLLAEDDVILLPFLDPHAVRMNTNIKNKLVPILAC